MGSDWVQLAASQLFAVSTGSEFVLPKRGWSSRERCNALRFRARLFKVRNKVLAQFQSRPTRSRRRWQARRAAARASFSAASASARWIGIAALCMTSAMARSKRTVLCLTSMLRACQRHGDEISDILVQRFVQRTPNRFGVVGKDRDIKNFLDYSLDRDLNSLPTSFSTGISTGTVTVRTLLHRQPSTKRLASRDSFPPCVAFSFLDAML